MQPPAGGQLQNSQTILPGQGPAPGPQMPHSEFVQTPGQPNTGAHIQPYGLTTNGPSQTSQQFQSTAIQHNINAAMPVAPAPATGQAMGYQQADPGAPTGTTPNIVQPPPVPQDPPIVTTVTTEGVDARAKPDPAVEASQRAATSAGAPGSAAGRKALLESALRCSLATFLIQSVLENSTLSKIKDPAAAKVHAVELLKLLTKDPGYGLKFKHILDDVPEWKKYVSQDHSLFITGPEQKSDYFLSLTDGKSEPTKFLTQG